jgi:excisionase family DNA binding protein
MLPSRLLSIKDLCDLVGISRRTVHRMRRAGELPEPVPMLRRVRWRAEDIDDWINGRAPQPTAQRPPRGPSS